MDYLKMPSLLRIIFVFCNKNCITVILCCLLLQHQDVVGSTQSNDNDVSIKYQKEGNNAILTCTAKNIGSRKIIWTKMSEPYPLTVGTTRFTPSRKISVKVNNNNVSTLTIRNVQLKDAGEYQCRLSGQVFAAEVITLSIKTGPDSTFIRPTATTVSAQVGGTALLPCEVENINDKLVLWKSIKDDIISVRSKVYIGDQRFRIVHDLAPQWSLEIQKLKETDFGTYICMVNSDPVLTRSVNLRNAAPPQSSPQLLLDSHFKKRITADAGQTVTLTCNFQSSPPANITWYRRRSGSSAREKIGAGNILKLDSVSVEQSGDYICIGENGNKPSAKGKTKLIVVAPPTPAAVLETTTFIPNGPTSPLLYAQKRTGVTLNTHAKLKCLAVGLPRPEIVWKKSGKLIINNFKYKIENSEEARHARHSELTIRQAISHDLGDYECEAFNQIGLTSLKLELY
ncbi:limbic system-associated membrane protein, partial [Biomphalaria pfeifferi]